MDPFFAQIKDGVNLFFSQLKDAIFMLVPWCVAFYRTFYPPRSLDFTPPPGKLRHPESVKKIAVLGATGQTGQRLVELALQQGHEVTAIVRNPGKLTAHHDKLKVVKVDIFSADDLKEHIKGHDVVISCLGFPPSFLGRVKGYTQSMGALVRAMREVKVNRIIVMTAWYTKPNSASKVSYLVQYVLLPMIRSILTDMDEMEHFLDGTQDINWTVVRPPGLKDLPATDKEFKTDEGYHVPAVGHSMSRGDVARFMLDQVNSDSWVKKGVAIATQ